MFVLLACTLIFHVFTCCRTTSIELPQGCTPNIISYHRSKVASCSRHLYVMVCTTNTIDHTFYPISTIINNDHIFSNLVLLIDLVYIYICLLVVESNGNVQKLNCPLQNKISNKVIFFFYVFCPTVKHQIVHHVQSTFVIAMNDKLFSFNKSHFS
jgi:hypothetical protein